MKILDGIYVSLRSISDAARRFEGRMTDSRGFMCLIGGCLAHSKSTLQYGPNDKIMTLYELLAEDENPPPVPNIDWSKAPEGATQCDVGSRQPWEKVEGDFIYFFGTRTRRWLRLTPTKEVNGRKGIIQRPTPYNGTTLPPVGTVCEIFRYDDWEKCTVVAHVTHRNTAMAVAQMDGSWCAYQSSSFRPISTERETAVAAMDKLVSEDLSSEPLAVLYDAGYRKVHAMNTGIIREILEEFYAHAICGLNRARAVRALAELDAASPDSGTDFKNSYLHAIRALTVQGRADETLPLIDAAIEYSRLRVTPPEGMVKITLDCAQFLSNAIDLVSDEGCARISDAYIDRLAELDAAIEDAEKAT